MPVFFAKRAFLCTSVFAPASNLRTALHTRLVVGQAAALLCCTAKYHLLSAATHLYYLAREGYLYS